MFQNIFGKSKFIFAYKLAVPERNIIRKTAKGKIYNLLIFLRFKFSVYISDGLISFNHIDESRHVRVTHYGTGKVP